jgi:hypothetical protein
MALTFRDYSAEQVEAAHSVLLEIVRLLGEYRDDIVVVGGWVPQFILNNRPVVDEWLTRILLVSAAREGSEWLRIPPPSGFDGSRLSPHRCCKWQCDQGGGGFPRR